VLVVDFVVVVFVEVIWGVVDVVCGFVVVCCFLVFCAIIDGVTVDLFGSSGNDWRMKTGVTTNKSDDGCVLVVVVVLIVLENVLNVVVLPVVVDMVVVVFVANVVILTKVGSVGKTNS
jgi:hypothetical protein